MTSTSAPTSSRSASASGALTSKRALLRTVLRVSTAAFVLAGGFIHYRLWQEQYKDLAATVPGRWVTRTGFPINAASSFVLAVGLIAIGFSLFARLRPLVLLGALALELGSIAMLVTTRYRAVFGWKEPDWGDWSGGPKRTIVVEILAVLGLLAVIVFDRDRPGEGESDAFRT